MLMCILLPVILIPYRIRNQLRLDGSMSTQTFIAADAATRAAGRTYAMTGDLEQRKLRPVRLLIEYDCRSRNPACGQRLHSWRIVSSGDSQRYVFTPGGRNPNALRVSIKKLNSSANGSIPLFMPNILNTREFTFEKIIRFHSSRSRHCIRSGPFWIYDLCGKRSLLAVTLRSRTPIGSLEIQSPNSRWLDLASAATASLMKWSHRSLTNSFRSTTYGTDASLDASIGSNYNAVRNAIGSIQALSAR